MTTLFELFFTSVTIKGRIGRLEYLRYALGAIVGFAATMGALIGIGTTFMPDPNAFFQGLVLAVFGLTVLGFVVYIVTLQVRRLHDIGVTGWAVLASHLPIVGQLMAFILFLYPGSAGANRYGEGTS